jgi:LuxR family transcriptional regulator, activator of conjugal transfer of Ti plasmids
MLTTNREALSDREKECLSWTALGKSSWSIGQILGISESTVNFHIKNVMKKLKTNSRTAAAVKAMSLGLIEPIVKIELMDEVNRCGLSPD